VGKKKKTRELLGAEKSSGHCRAKQKVKGKTRHPRTNHPPREVLNQGQIVKQGGLLSRGKSSPTLTESKWYGEVTGLMKKRKRGTPILSEKGQLLPKNCLNRGTGAASSGPWSRREKQVKKEGTETKDKLRHYAEIPWAMNRKKKRGRVEKKKPETAKTKAENKQHTYHRAKEARKWKHEHSKKYDPGKPHP